MSESTPGTHLRRARQRANLSQRDLARRAGTAQSVVARIEGGQTSPTWETLVHLFDQLGFALDIQLVTQPASAAHMLDDVTRILRLTPEARLAELRNAAGFFAAAHRA